MAVSLTVGHEAKDERKLEALEVELLLEGIAARWGYDFRNYARASLSRRVRRAMLRENLPTVSALQERALRDEACMARFVAALTVHITAMFRDPEFYITLREHVVPLLRTYPFVRIWHAGCSTGEEVYSTAILLHEEGLYERCRIYATDLSDAVLERARRGIYSLDAMRDFSQNYQRAGGRNEFSSYYVADHRNAIFRESLRKNIVFSQHNLACDGAFNEFNLVVCRNVMIYFDETLRARVRQLFDESLCRLGVLGLGKKETLRHTELAHAYSELPGGARLFRRLS
jgi:chemotaxis protein methyltransferase CheR